MIVRNEENILSACLESAADLVDEVVVVDTGSTDHTRDIARQFRARVFDFPWVDSFAAARNESLRHATGDWIFWLDADDRIDAANRTKLKRLFAGLGKENKAFEMKYICLPKPGNVVTPIRKHVRLFRNHPQARWKNRIYEDIITSLTSLGASVVTTDISINHAGYQDPAVSARKFERDLRLLQLDYAEGIDKPFALFNMGRIYLAMGRAADALPMLRQSLECFDPGNRFARTLHRFIVECHRLLGQKEEALAACVIGRTRFPLDLGLRAQEAQLREETGDLAGAECCYRHLLRDHETDELTEMPASFLGFWAKQRLASLYTSQDRMIEAKNLWLGD